MRLLVFTLIFFSISSLSAQDYYSNSLEQLQGDELRAALHQLIDQHVVYSYSDCKTILKESDEDPLNNSNIVLVYKQNSIDKDNFAYSSDVSMFDYWNREHVWAKSLGSFGPGGIYENSPANTDVHNLKPSDQTMNSDRGNLSYDNGGQSHVENPNVKFTYQSWEVPDEVKGDIARILFYMDVRYDGGEGEPNLTIVDMLDTYPNPYIGKLTTLLEWHELDPVDDFELNRNEVIYSWQNNRNPFIDNPEFVDRIWGLDTTLVVQEPRLFISEYLEGNSYDKAIEIFNPTGATIDLEDYELWQIFNGGEWAENILPLSGNILSGQTYVVCHPNADDSIINTSDMYLELLFNGNDAIGLAHLGVLIDQIGTSGSAPSFAWNVDSITDATTNNGLIRKSFVQEGTTDWNLASGQSSSESEWVVYELGNYTSLGTHTFNETSNIELPEGWSMVGFDVDVSELSVPEVFEMVSDHLIIVKNAEGDVYLPEWEFNNITSITVGEGLIIKMSLTQNLYIEGHLIDIETSPLIVPIGWSCRAILSNAQIDTQQFFQDCTSLVIVKDDLGAAYLPSYNFNGIGVLEPKKAYLIKSDGLCSLTW